MVDGTRNTPETYIYTIRYISTYVYLISSHTSIYHRSYIRTLNKSNYLLIDQFHINDEFSNEFVNKEQEWISLALNNTGCLTGHGGRGKVMDYGKKLRGHRKVLDFGPFIEQGSGEVIPDQFEFFLCF